MISYHEQDRLSLEILGLEREPPNPTGLFNNWAASDELLDYEIVHLMLEFLDVEEKGMWTGELAEQLGPRASRIAGRMRSLRSRGIVKPVPKTIDVESIIIPECAMPKSKRGKPWCFTAATKRRIESS